MRAKDLLPGDIFRVDPPDPESAYRICLTNNEKEGIRFGWPGKSRYWCWMGEDVEVELIRKEE